MSQATNDSKTPMALAAEMVTMMIQQGTIKDPLSIPDLLVKIAGSLQGMSAPAPAAAPVRSELVAPITLPNVAAALQPSAVAAVAAPKKDAAKAASTEIVTPEPVAAEEAAPVVAAKAPRGKSVAAEKTAPVGTPKAPRGKSVSAEVAAKEAPKAVAVAPEQTAVESSNAAPDANEGEIYRGSTKPHPAGRLLLWKLRKASEHGDKPAVPVRDSVTPDAIICLEDGRPMKMLKRHISTVYGMTAEEYLWRWSLPAGYPMVAPNYAKQKSKYARSVGLGSHRMRDESAAKRAETVE